MTLDQYCTIVKGANHILNIDFQRASADEFLVKSWSICIPRRLGSSEDNLPANRLVQRATVKERQSKFEHAGAISFGARLVGSLRACEGLEHRVMRILREQRLRIRDAECHRAMSLSCTLNDGREVCGCVRAEILFLIRTNGYGIGEE